MKNKSYYLLIILVLFIVCLFSFKIYYSSITNNLVFNHINFLNKSLSKRLVDNFFSEDNDIKNLASKSIKEIVLRDLGFENWLDYIEFIDISLYPIDIVHDDTEDLIIAVNLSKDQGAIGVYRLYEDKYLLANKITNLCKIKNISAIRVESSDKAFIVVEEVLDEIIGAYFVDNYIRIFSETKGNFIEVFRQSTDYLAYYFEKWGNPNSVDPKWYKVTEISVVDNITLEKGNIVINVSKSLAKYEALNSDSSSIPSDFRLIEENHFDVKLVWSETYNTFIMAEGKITSQDTHVGILEDTSQTVDYLLNLTGKYYKVIDKNERILYINSDDIIITRDFSTL